MSRKLLHYLLLSFALSWASAGMVALSPVEADSLWGTLLMGFVYMWGPALAVIILQLGVYREKLRPYGWQFERIRWPWMLWNLLTPIALVLLTLGGGFILGNLLGIEGMGRVDMSKESLLFRTEELMIQAGQDPSELAESGNLFTSLPVPGWVLLPLMLILGIIPGATINLVFAFGEELGWRGLMLEETKQLGYWRSALFIGIMWGLWHAPLILMGHNYPGTPYAGIGMMMLFCVAMSMVMNLLAMRSGTIVGAAAFHGVVNAIAGAPLLYVRDANALLGGPAGLAGVLGAMIMVGVLAWRFGDDLDNWAQWHYDPAQDAPNPPGGEASA